MTTNTEKYNGWTNRETWLVNLWLTNDSGSEADCRALASIHGATVALDNALEDYVINMAPEQPDTAAGTMFSDLRTAALARVNWHEIATAFEE